VIGPLLQTTVLHEAVGCCRRSRRIDVPSGIRGPQHWLGIQL